MHRAHPLMWEYGRTPDYLYPGREDDKSPNLAIRDGRWKLLINADGTRAELYDFSKSDKERDNVADRYPDVVKRLSAQVIAWRKSLPVLE